MIVAKEAMGSKNFKYDEIVQNAPNHFLKMGYWSEFPFQNPEISDKIIEHFNH